MQVAIHILLTFSTSPQPNSLSHTSFATISYVYFANIKNIIPYILQPPLFHLVRCGLNQVVLNSQRWLRYVVLSLHIASLLAI